MSCYALNTITMHHYYLVLSISLLTQFSYFSSSLSNNVCGRILRLVVRSIKSINRMELPIAADLPVGLSGWGLSDS